MISLEYLWDNWGDAYVIRPPCLDCVKWRAIARFGQEDILLADGSSELLDKIRQHYQGSQRAGDRSVWL
jgi:hypothetical protein